MFENWRSRADVSFTIKEAKYSLILVGSIDSVVFYMLVLGMLTHLFINNNV